MTRVIGDMPCIRCGRTVWWDRVGTSWRLMEGRAAHDCPGERVVERKSEPVSDRCGAYMRNSGEICARKRGHSMTGGHRSRFIMDEEAERRRTWRMAA